MQEHHIAFETGLKLPEKRFINGPLRDGLIASRLIENLKHLKNMFPVKLADIEKTPTVIEKLSEFSLPCRDRFTGKVGDRALGKSGMALTKQAIGGIEEAMTLQMM